MSKTKDAILRDAIKHYGPVPQIHKSIEELSELIRALSRTIDRMDTDDVDNVAEEMADVRIMLGQMEIIYGNRDRVREIEWLKLTRLKERMMADA